MGESSRAVDKFLFLRALGYRIRWAGARTCLVNERRFQYRTLLKALSHGYTVGPAYDLSAAGLQRVFHLLKVKPKSIYSVGCQYCGREQERTVFMFEEQIELLGWHLCPGHPPYDGNANYYCPSCMDVFSSSETLSPCREYVAEQRRQKAWLTFLASEGDKLAESRLKAAGSSR